jgi:hypothetical protein
MLINILTWNNGGTLKVNVSSSDSKKTKLISHRLTRLRGSLMQSKME